MHESFVVGNKIRLAVFVEVLSGESGIERIVKKHRLIPQAAERAADELAEQGIVSRSEGKLALTDVGTKLAHELKRNELIK